MKFLKRLFLDSGGNTLALAAASIIPLIGIVGGGLDMSRAYLVKTRLQQACDAGTLAARKKLGGSSISGNTIPADITNAAHRFFDANFKDGTYATENRDFVLTAGSATRMDGVASVEMPMALMQVFGFGAMDISVDCSAELNLPNIDVMLVLDLSGSMSASRMDALKSAVFSFYDEVHAVKPDGARVRIGVVPYSGAVNVGDILRSANPNWLADSWTYQSREAVFESVMTSPGTDGEWEEYSYARELVPYEISDWGNSGASLRWPNNNPAKNRCNDMGQGSGTEYFIGDERWVVDSDHFLKNHFSGGGWKSACDLRIRKFRQGTPSGPTYEDQFQHYVHKPIVFDTSQFKLGNSVSTPTGTQGANVASSWNGCIEERQTFAGTTEADFDPIPAAALDLDINRVPDPADPATQWKPMWPQITYNRPDQNHWTTTSNQSTRGYNCPSAARKLQEYPLQGGSRNADFQSYINALSPTGGTMHDIGMIWGARLITPRGIFQSENENAPNGDPISRHIIFMTDGQMGANPSNTTSYGNYNLDGRFAGFKNGGWSENELAQIHNYRLAAVCDRIKNENITIWTITFELPQNTYTRGCASGDARAFSTNGADELATAFRNIATSIAELRLVR